MTEYNINLLRVVLFRTLQTLAVAAPTLLCGLLLAGAIRGMVGSAAVRRWFTDDPRIGPARAWLTGLLLPVCSFGVLPIAWELRRAGVPRATVITFLLAAPLADPFSLTYAFQKLESQGAFGLGMFVFTLIGSFVILVGTGVLLGRWFPEAPAQCDLTPLPGTGLRRVGVAALTAARGATGRLFVFVLAGSIGSGLLAIVPGGALERAANDRSWEAPLHTALVSVPCHIPPGPGVVYFCEMLLNGSSVGSAFVFFVLGMGLNLATLAWIFRSYGTRILACAAPLVMGTTLAIGFAMPVSLPSAAASMSQNHFFEIEAGGGAKTQRLRLIRSTLTNPVGDRQWLLIGAWGALGCLAVAGLVSRGLGARGTISHWMTSSVAQPTVETNVAWNKTVSAPQLALAGMAFMLVTAVAGLFVYYPAPTELLDEMDGVHVELVLALKSDPVPRENALRLTAQWQRLQHKLAVADLLRRGRFDSRLTAKSEELRVAIDRFRQALVEGGDREELTMLCTEAHQAASRCHQALDVSPVSE